MNKVIKQQVSELVQAIEVCLEKQLIMPGLILIYSGIDILASLEKNPKESVMNSFTKWVDLYMLASNSLPVTAIELYAARCGILHTLSANSNLSKQKKARRIIYAWGSANTEDLKKANDFLPTANDISLHISDLIKSFKEGTIKYFEELEKEPNRKERVLRELNWFTNLSKETLSEFLSLKALINNELK